MFVGKIFALIAHYGYAGLFVSLVLGIVGLPIPDEVIMTFIGFLALKGTLNLILSIIVSIVGSISGMLISYAVGRRFGYPLLRKFGPKIHINDRRIDQFQAWFKTRGKWAITIGYFIPGVRHLTAYFSGIGRWQLPTFLFYASIGATIWSITFILLGYFLGEEWENAAIHFHHTLVNASVYLAIFILFYFVFRLIRSSKQ